MYGTPSLHAIKYAVAKSILCVVVLVRTFEKVYCLLERTNHVDLSELVQYHPRGPGDAATRIAAVCGFFRGSNRNHYYLLLVLVMRPLAHVYIHVCTCACTYTEIQ